MAVVRHVLYSFAETSLSILLARLRRPFVLRLMLTAPPLGRNGIPTLLDLAGVSKCALAVQ